MFDKRKNVNMAFAGSTYKKGQHAPSGSQSGHTPQVVYLPQAVCPTQTGFPPQADYTKSSFQCATCQMTFKDSSALMTHMEATNHGTWFYCDFCSWSFVTDSLKQDHVQQQHRGQQKGAQQATRSNMSGKRNALAEGGSLDSGAKKDYDRIVRAFVEDDTVYELEFPSTLTATERHHVHKLAMHFFLEHKSFGPDTDRRLQLKKKNSEAIAAKQRLTATSTANATGDHPRVKTVDGYQGAQWLNNPYATDFLCDIETLLKPLAHQMMRTLHHEAVARVKVTHRRFTATDKGLAQAPTRNAAADAQSQSLLQFRQKLPAYVERESVLNSVRNNKVTIVCGETGCGKTTQLPQLLWDDGMFPADSQIICTQPRRISALSVANRVAQERGEQCGDSCGYAIRFENQSSARTRILYVTTGILLRRLHTDPFLSGVSCVILDEVHERDVDTDFSLLLLRDIILQPRPGQAPLKIVVMSATIQIDRLVNYFASANGPRPPTTIIIKGTLFPVKEYFLDDALQWLNLPASAAPAMLLQQEVEKRERESYDMSKNAHLVRKDGTLYEKIKSTVVSEIDMEQETVIPYTVIVSLIEYFHTQHHQDCSGSILVFLPGWGPMDRIAGMVRRSQYCKELSLHLLHSSISSQEQARVFIPPPRGFRKVVLATNVAETSITIDDVVFVIDSGLLKGTAYDAAGNTSSLKSQLIAKANGTQRRGRAGRCRPGVCVHLLPKQAYLRLPDFLPPEMVRSSLDEICLQIKAVKDDACMEVLSKAMDPPSKQSIWHAVEFLKELGAFDSQERLTHLGRALATLPLHPLLGKMLFVATVLGVLDPVATIAAALSSKSPFIKPLPHQFAEARSIQEAFDKGDNSDHLTVLKLFRGWKNSNMSNDYAYRNFADPNTLRAMNRTKMQLERLVQQSGFMKKMKEDATRYASRNSDNSGLIRLTLLWSLYPRVAVMERHRTRGKMESFCWDNKPSQFHQSSILFKKKLDEAHGYEFVVYFERMRIESVLCIFDASTVSRTMMVLCAGEMTLHHLDASKKHFITDTESKFGPWEGPTVETDIQRLAASQDKSHMIVQLESDAKKLFVVPSAEGLMLRRLRETMDFYFHWAVKAVDASVFPPDLVIAIGYAIGYPVQVITDCPSSTSGSPSSTRMATPGSSWTRSSMSSDDDDSGVPRDGVDAQIEAISEEAIRAIRRGFGDLAILQRLTDRPEALRVQDEFPGAPAVIQDVATTSPVAAPPLVRATHIHFVDPAIISIAVAEKRDSPQAGDEAVPFCFNHDLDDSDEDDVVVAVNLDTLLST